MDGIKIGSTGYVLKSLGNEKYSLIAPDGKTASLNAQQCKSLLNFDPSVKLKSPLNKDQFVKTSNSSTQETNFDKMTKAPLMSMPTLIPNVKLVNPAAVNGAQFLDSLQLLQAGLSGDKEAAQNAYKSMEQSFNAQNPGLAYLNNIFSQNA